MVGPTKNTSRAPCSLALQGAPREVRALLCSSLYEDVDMVNSFPRIALAFARMFGIPHLVPQLRRYVEGDPEHGVTAEEAREGLLAEIVEAHGLSVRESSRELAKILPITLLHAGTYSGWIKNVEPPNATVRVPAVVEFSAEVLLIIRRVLASNIGIAGAMNAMRNQIALEKKRGKTAFKTGAVADVDRTIFARVMQSYEDDLLAIVIDVFVRYGWTVGSLQFDGLYIDAVNAPTNISLDETIARAEQAVHDLTDGQFSILLKRKHMFGTTTSHIMDQWRTVHHEAP